MPHALASNLQRTVKVQVSEYFVRTSNPIFALEPLERAPNQLLLCFVLPQKFILILGALVPRPAVYCTAHLRPTAASRHMEVRGPSSLIPQMTYLFKDLYVYNRYFH